MLLERGGLAQLQATDEDGYVPMHYAAQYNPSAEAAGWVGVVLWPHEQKQSVW